MNKVWRLLRDVGRFYLGSAVRWVRYLIGPVLFLATAGVLLGAVVYLLDSGGEEVDGTAVAGLAALALVALVLAIGGPRLLRSMSKLGPEGIEFGQQNAEVLRVPAFFDTIRIQAGMGWWSRTLTPEEQYAYDLGSQLILHYEHLGLQPWDLNPSQLQRYVDLVIRVGSWSLTSGDYRSDKALYLLKRLEEISDVPAEGNFLLAEAYRLTYVRRGGKDQTYVKKAKRLLQKSVRQDDDDATIWWSLAWVHCELRRYNPAIEQAKKAISLEPELASTAYWIIAIAQLKRKDGGPTAALETLIYIDPGRLWNLIYSDSDFDELRRGRYASNFAALCWCNYRQD